MLKPLSPRVIKPPKPQCRVLVSVQDNFGSDARERIRRRFFRAYYVQQGNLKVRGSTFKPATYETRKAAIQAATEFSGYLRMNAMVLRRPDKSYTFAPFTGDGVEVERVASCFGGKFVYAVHSWSI